MRQPILIAIFVLGTIAPFLFQKEWSFNGKFPNFSSITNIFSFATKNTAPTSNLVCEGRFPYEYQRGIASWYGNQFHGRQMANQEIFDEWADTVAHLELPKNIDICVVNPENGRWVIAKMTDRGPYVEPRIIDVSHGIAQKLKIGVTEVVIRLAEPPSSYQMRPLKKFASS